MRKSCPHVPEGPFFPPCGDCSRAAWHFRLWEAELGGIDRVIVPLYDEC